MLAADGKADQRCRDGARASPGVAGRHSPVQTRGHVTEHNACKSSGPLSCLPLSYWGKEKGRPSPHIVKASLLWLLFSRSVASDSLRPGGL